MADPVSQTTSKEISWQQLVYDERAKEVPAYKPVDYRFSGGTKPREFEVVGEFYTS